MWNCPKCGEQLEDTFDACWKCAGSEPPLQEEETGDLPEAVPAPPAPPRQHLAYRIFGTGFLSTLDKVMQEAADFATGIGPERVVNLSHSMDRMHGVVVVWYWQPTPGV